MAMNNDSVIEALRTSLESNPNDTNIMAHLAELLLTSEEANEALILYQKILASNPSDVVILKGALKAAEQLGNESLVTAYQKLLSALGSHDIEFDEDDDESNVEDIGAQRVRGAKLRLVSEEDDIDSAWDVEESNIYLKDVGGMEDVKKRLHLSFLGPLQNPELMKAYGKSVGGGLMLYGPPGCGKTFIARALAGEIGAKFMAVGLSDILDMYIGESERKLHEIFNTARRAAPSILFFDELDAIGQKRSHLRNSGMRTLVNQLLAEMDSVGNDNDNVYILGATNHPWDVDSALRRPGRFNRMEIVLPPDTAAREAILTYHLKNKPAESVDVKYLAKHTGLMSGADLAHLCESAIEYVLEESLSTGKTRSLCTDDFALPLQEVKPSTKPWFENARNFAMFANDSGSYDDLLNYINKMKL